LRKRAPDDSGAMGMVSSGGERWGGLARRGLRDGREATNGSPLGGLSAPRNLAPSHPRATKVAPGQSPLRGRDAEIVAPSGHEFMTRQAREISPALESLLLESQTGDIPEWPHSDGVPLAGAHTAAPGPASFR
jgi:hypothetical protein